MNVLQTLSASASSEGNCLGFSGCSGPTSAGKCEDRHFHLTLACFVGKGIKQLVVMALTFPALLWRLSRANLAQIAAFAPFLTAPRPTV